MSNDLDMEEWLREFEQNFELVPTKPEPKKRVYGCLGGIHTKNTTPVVLPEKQFEAWIVCKHCGKALVPGNK